MNRVELPIASPCAADWTTMTLSDRGRFCGQCRKVVRELAQLTEPEARAMLAAPPTEGLCVRYVHDATGEILFRRDVVPVSHLSRVRRAAAVALAAASLPMAAAGCMGAAPMPRPMMGAAPMATQTATTPPVELMGDVTMGEPPPHVIVMPPAPVATDPTIPHP